MGYRIIVAFILAALSAMPAHGQAKKTRVKSNQTLTPASATKVADEIRQQLLNAGIQIEDSPNGTTWSPLSS